MKLKMIAGFSIAVVIGIAEEINAADLRISIGIRETGTAAPIGGDGGATGDIEWIRLDAQSLPLDGQYHTLTYNFGSDPVSAFTGNGVLNGTRGTLENIRIRNFDGVSVPIYLFIDNLRNTTAAGTQPISDFEGFGNGVEVTFQEPNFSGSTSGNIAAAPNIALTTNTSSSQGTVSDQIQFRFIDNNPTRWLRLTTFAATNLPNPAIDFSPGNTLSFDIRGVVIPEPGTAGGLGVYIAAFLMSNRHSRRVPKWKIMK